MLKIIVLSVICSMHVQLLCAQKHTISGYVKDGVSGETLIGATLSVKGLSKGITTNAYGFYSISIPGGSQGLEFSYVGYQPLCPGIRGAKNQKLIAQPGYGIVYGKYFFILMCNYKIAICSGF